MAARRGEAQWGFRKVFVPLRIISGGAAGALAIDFWGVLEPLKHLGSSIVDPTASWRKDSSIESKVVAQTRCMRNALPRSAHVGLRNIDLRTRHLLLHRVMDKRSRTLPRKARCCFHTMAGDFGSPVRVGAGSMAGAAAYDPGVETEGNVNPEGRGSAVGRVDERGVGGRPCRSRFGAAGAKYLEPFKCAYSMSSMDHIMK